MSGQSNENDALDLAVAELRGHLYDAMRDKSNAKTQQEAARFAGQVFAYAKSLSLLPERPDAGVRFVFSGYRDRRPYDALVAYFGDEREAARRLGRPDLWPHVTPPGSQSP